MRKSEDIMEWTLKNAYPALVTGLASELCSMKKKYLQVFQQYKNSPPGHHGQEGFVHLWDLCIHIDINTGF